MGYPEDLQEQDFLNNSSIDEGFIGYNPQEQPLDLNERFRRLAEKNDRLEKETGFETIKRHAKSYAARGLETLASFPGNFKKAFNQTRDFLESFSDKSKNLRQLEEEAFGNPEVGSLEYEIMNLPTSSEVRGIVSPAIAEKMGKERDYFEPITEGEEVGGELVQDLTSFFMPGTGQMRMATRIGAPIIGNLSKQGFKYLGADEKTAEKVKNGVMLATTLAGQSNPNQFGRNRIAQAREMVPQNATVNAAPMAHELIPLMQRMQRGFRVPSKSRTIQGLNELAAQVDQNGRINLQSLMDARDGINEWISEAGGFDIPSASRPALLRNLNELKRNITHTINENLSSRYPQAAELYQTGYEALAVTHESNAITNFIEKHFGKKTASIGVKLLFPGLSVGAPFFPKAAGAAAITFPVYKGGQILYRVGNSPTLARYYSEVIRSSMQGNVPAMVHNMEKLDKELEKIEKKEQKRTKRRNKSTFDEFKQRFIQ